MSVALKQKKFLIEFLEKICVNSSSSKDDKSNVLIDVFLTALEHVDDRSKQKILDAIEFNYKVKSPISFYQEQDNLPF